MTILAIVWLMVPAIIGVACPGWIGRQPLNRRRFVIRCSWILAIYYLGIVTLFLLAWVLRPTIGQRVEFLLQAGWLLILLNPVMCGVIVIQAYVVKDSLWNVCMNCGYPVGKSSVCTECGAAVTPKS